MIEISPGLIFRTMHPLLFKPFYKLMLLGNARQINAQTETATVSILIALGQPKSTRGRHIKYTHLRRRYILSGVRVPLHAMHTNVRVHSVHGRQIG